MATPLRNGYRMEKKLLLFEPDMLFASRIEGVATRSELEVKVTVTVDELERALRESVPKALIVDLDVLAAIGAPLLERLRNQCKLVGYYSHADSKLAAQALASGFEIVVPRRSLMDRLSKLFADIGSG